MKYFQQWSAEHNNLCYMLCSVTIDLLSVGHLETSHQETFSLYSPLNLIYTSTKGPKYINIVIW